MSRSLGWLGGVVGGFLGGVRWSEEELERVQRTTMRTLTASQALGGIGMSIGIAVTALLAEELSGRESLAGLAQTMQVVGAAGASYLLARLSGRHGRRLGLTLGYLLGALGAVVCVVAGVVGSFPLMLAGATLIGATTAANYQSRYAATDLARPGRKARALSLVMWATTIGAVAGPNLTGVAGDTGARFGLPVLTGPFVFGAVGMLAAALVVWFRLRPDPLLVARAAAVSQGASRQTGTSWSRVRDVVRTRPAVAGGVAALALAHAVMVAVMVMTPLHMHHGGADLEIIGVVISGHVLGMFAFSPLVGWAADTFGRPLVLSSGAVVLLMSLVLSGTAPTGASYRLGVGLFLLGLGWSMCTVAASTLLSEASPIEARTDVQGAADLVMNLTAAVGGALAGVVVGTLGYPSLALFAGVLVAGIATAAEYARHAPADEPVPL